MVSEPTPDSYFFLFPLSPTTPMYTPSPVLYNPHLSPPVPLTTHTPPIPFQDWVLNRTWARKCSLWCLRKFHQRREFKKETQEEGNWERKPKKGQKQTSRTAFYLVPQVHSMSCSREMPLSYHPHSVSESSDLQSNLHLSYLSYSVLWSKGLIRRKVQHQKDLDPNGSSVTHKPLALAMAVTSICLRFLYLQTGCHSADPTQLLETGWDAAWENTLETVIC